MFQNSGDRFQRQRNSVYLSDQNFVGMGSIKISSIKEGDSFGECIVDYRDANLFRNRIIIYSSKPHTPKSQLRNLSSSSSSWSIQTKNISRLRALIQLKWNHSKVHIHIHTSRPCVPSFTLAICASAILGRPFPISRCWWWVAFHWQLHI